MNSGVTRRRHHDADEIRGVARPELLHDVGAMVLDGARADAEMAAGFLVGSAPGELFEYFALAPRQRFAAGEMQRLDIRSRVPGLAARIGVDRLVQPRHDLAAAERLLDEVERAVLDGTHRHGVIALAGDHEDLSRII